MPTYLVELYASRGTAIAARRVADAIGASASTTRYLRTILVPGDETCFCLVEASSVTSLAELARAAGVELDRIVEVVLDGVVDVLAD